MPRPFAELGCDRLRQIRVLALDIDDTLTVDGYLTRPVLEMAESLHQRGFRLVLVTGRPAAIVLGLTTYFQWITAAVAENGGARVGKDHAAPLLEDSSFNGLVPRLLACEEKIQKAIPSARRSGDGFARLTDRTFLVEGLTVAGRKDLDRIAAEAGFATIASSIHVHVHTPGIDKSWGLRRILTGLSPAVSPEEVLTMGDSGSDAPLFNAEHFPVSVGVANIAPHLARMTHTPAFVTDESEGHGFCAVGRALLAR